ncbi:hypothetical protein E2C01_052007 [Portunus trituberculatus]|uniref:Uncharacterized protein n=1 Tax=Portunus trituberculatus TaxID=210409 RepID=A0A5B7GKU2_PORTR|nr:hypothetical protein [Portunus trituberculatus]
MFISRSPRNAIQSIAAGVLVKEVQAGKQAGKETGGPHQSSLHAHFNIRWRESGGRQCVWAALTLLPGRYLLVQGQEARDGQD